MFVTSGISLQQMDGSWRKLSVGLGDNDLDRMLIRDSKLQEEIGFDPAALVDGGDERPSDHVDVRTAYKVLFREADRLLIAKMAKDELISMDVAKQELSKIAAL